MSLSFFIAQRYLQTQRRKGSLSFITTIAIIGVMLGTAALIIALCVLDGFEQEIKSKVISFTSHIEVQGFQNMPLDNYLESMRKVKRDVSGVKLMTPFAAREGMIRSRDGVDGVFLKGIDPSVNLSTPNVHLVEGHALSETRTSLREIILGRSLANRLNVKLGDKVVIFALPRSGLQSGQPRVMQFILIGIYESGMTEFDDVFAYTDLSSAQTLLQIGDMVTGYDILVNNLDSVDAVAKKVQQVLGYPHFARTVFESYRNLFSWAELQKKLSPILLSLIIIVATVNIIGTLLMFVLEKTQSIGILKSLGAGPGLIQKIFTIQGLLMGTVGIALGNVLALIFCWSQTTFKILSLPSDIYYMDKVPIVISPENFILVTIVALILCLLATLLPAKAASRLQIVRALRFG